MTAATETGCSGLRLARERAARRPALAFDALTATIRVGSFVRPLPRDTGQMIRLAFPLMNVAMQIEPRWLDGPPVLETRFGAVPVLELERCPWLERLDAEGRAGTNEEQLILAAVVLHDHLRLLEQAWELKRLGVWQTLRDVEVIAADLLSAHLTSNLQTASRERDRYLYPGPELMPRAETEAFKGLQRAVARVAEARAAAQVDVLKTEQIVVEAVSLAMSVLAVAGAMNRGAVLLDRTAWAQINAAAGLADEARAHSAEAVGAYLQVLRREAFEHPLVLVLSHRALAGANVLAVARAIDEAVRDAEAAIVKLRSEGVNVATVPEVRTPRELTMTGLSERLASAGTLSVWKLPFFAERALCEVPPERATEVVRLLELAAETAGGAAIRRSLGLFGIETAMMFAPAAGPVGIGLAVAWALFNLGGSIIDYQQLSALFHATLDPAVLLRGPDHDGASKVAIVLDLIGLIVW